MGVKEKSLCFCGKIRESLLTNKDYLEELYKRIEVEIDNHIKNGISIFYLAVSNIFELMCAKAIISRKKVIKIDNPKFIKLIAVLSFEEEANDWLEVNRAIYFNVLSECDNVITLHTQYKQGCYHERSRYMVEHSSKLICYFDGSNHQTGYMMDFAEKNYLQIINLYQPESIN